MNNIKLEYVFVFTEYLKHYGRSEIMNTATGQVLEVMSDNYNLDRMVI
jgi:hypothetical protein